MNESDLLAGVPDWAKYLGGTSGVLIAVSLWLRQWLSSSLPPNAPAPTA